LSLHVCDTAEALGRDAAKQSVRILEDCLREQGYARIVLSTGASQFTFFQALAAESLDWSKVEMFHLDEYVGLKDTHPASFRLYLRERFLSFAKVRRAHLIDGEGDLDATIARLGEEIASAPIDLALIGIGENAHIAFNDPPADFDDEAAYKVVDLDEACKAQQVREGWFESVELVPRQAITMTVRQILRSRHIISCVPHQVKARAIQLALAEGVTNWIPASILKSHASWDLYLDRESSSLL